MGLGDIVDDNGGDSSSSGRGSGGKSKKHVPDDPLSEEAIEDRKADTSKSQHKALEDFARAVKRDGVIQGKYALYRRVTDYLGMRGTVLVTDDGEEIVDTEGEEVQIRSKEFKLKFGEMNQGGTVYEVRVRQ